MPVITLTTDLGLKDHYAGVLKGEILTRTPDANMIDISHLIEPFNISQAAHVLKNAYKSFPAGTIHLVCVDTGYSSAPAFVMLKTDGYIFAGPDNGIFPLIFGENMPDTLFQLKRKTGQGLFALYGSAVADIHAGKPAEDFCTILSQVRPAMSWQPQVENDFIRGRIIYIDRFQNCVVNISREIFEQKKNGRQVRILFKRYNDIVDIRNSYADESLGEKLARFNDDGLLEIAMNKGNAAGLLGLQINDVVQVDFTGA